jgi:AraC-like DNA-binding protein
MNCRVLKEIVKCCGFGGASRLGRAIRARFSVPPQRERARVGRRDLDWREARLTPTAPTRGPSLGGNSG